MNPAQLPGSARVGDEIQTALIGAYEQTRDRDYPVVGADVLLYELLRKAVDLRKRLGLVNQRLKSAMAEPGTRGAGVDPPVGSEDAADTEIAAALLEARWRADGGRRPAVPRQWASAVPRALRAALRMAMDNRAPYAGPRHLLETLIAEGPDDVQAFIRNCDFSPTQLAVEAASLWPMPAAGSAYIPTVETLSVAGVVPESRSRAKSAEGRLLRFAAWRGRSTPLLTSFEIEVARQAVRLDHNQVTTAHILLALLSLHEQALLAQRAEVEVIGTGGDLLVTAGLTHQRLTARLTGNPESDASPRRNRWQAQREKMGNPKWSVQAARAMDGAHSQGRHMRQSMQSVLLLATAIAEPDGAACTLLDDIGVSVAALSGHVNHLLETASHTAES